MDYNCLINVILFVDEPSHEPIFKIPFLSPLPAILPYTLCQVDKFLNDKITITQMVGIQKYLIYTEKVPIDDTWLNRSELPKIDHEILK